MPNLNSPPNGSLNCSAMLVSVLTSRSIFCAWATICSPAGDSMTCRLLRSMSVTPRNSSSFFSWVDKVGWLTKQASAARPKCRTSLSCWSLWRRKFWTKVRPSTSLNLFLRPLQYYEQNCMVLFKKFKMTDFFIKKMFFKFVITCCNLYKTMNIHLLTFF